MKLQRKHIRRVLLVIVPVTLILFSYQNCAPPYNFSTGPTFDSQGNLIPPSNFSADSDDSSGSDTSGGETGNGGSLPANSQGNNGSGNGQTGKVNIHKCVNQSITAKQRAIKSANAFDSAKKFLQNRRCNAFLSGPNGQAKSLIQETEIQDYCLSDLQNTFQLLRQVGRKAGMQDVDQYNQIEKWIDCFCNVSGNAICPELQTKKPKDVFDVQDHFVDPAKRKPALKLEDIPLNEDDVSGADEILND
jgi:hypothetical protein